MRYCTDIVNKINKDLKKILGPDFNLLELPGQHHIRLFKTVGISEAVNRINESPVKVFKWFDTYWLYLEVKFVTSGKGKNFQPNTLISLSVYDGDEFDEKKTQLFRAEWDDMNNQSEVHSQPHWHITSNQALERIFNDYVDDSDYDYLVPFFKLEKSKIIDVDKLHFAMNGNWQNNDSHIHKIESPEQITSWLKGLLMHIRTELENIR